MAYIDYEYYKSLYGEEKMQEAEFNRVLWDAEREIDKATSGIDGVKKLKIAFPLGDDGEIVKRCIVELVNFLSKLEEAEKNANSLYQMTERHDGALQGKVISSVSAGNESISYAVGKSADTAISNAIKDLHSKDMAVYQFIASKLSGVSDLNNVNLLYAGRYPLRLESTNEKL